MTRTLITNENKEIAPTFEHDTPFEVELELGEGINGDAANEGAEINELLIHGNYY